MRVHENIPGLFLFFCANGDSDDSNQGNEGKDYNQG